MSDPVPRNAPYSQDMSKLHFPNPGKPSRYYMLASVPRSGSNLLCGFLRRTGCAGAPEEYLSPNWVLRTREQWGDLTFADYLRKIIEVRTSPNGVFGVKAHFDQLKHMTSQGLDAEDMFPGLTYIRVRRGDMIRQAISLTRADQTEQWMTPIQARTQPMYSAGAIYHAWQRIVKWEREWDTYFAERGLEPLTINYEELDGNLEGAVQRILAHLEIDEPDIQIPLPATGKQRDDLTEEWYRRFMRDSRPGLLSKLRYRLHKKKIKRLLAK